MALQFNRTDADTGHTWTVYARIDGGTVLMGDTTSVTLDMFDSVGAAQTGFKPVMAADRVLLSSAEMTATNPAFVSALTAALQAGSINSPSDALKTAMYTLLKQRPAYSSALSV